MWHFANALHVAKFGRQSTLRDPWRREENISSCSDLWFLFFKKNRGHDDAYRSPLQQSRDPFMFSRMAVDVSDWTSNMLGFTLLVYMSAAI